MPIFDVHCSNTECVMYGHYKEEIYKFDENLGKCSLCDSDLQKLVSKAAFILKGRWPGKDIKKEK